MRLNGWFLTVSLFCLALIGYLLWMDYQRGQLLRLRVKKMYASSAFAAMWPDIKRCQTRTIEQFKLDKNGFTVSFLQPAGRTAMYATIESIRFDLAKQGFMPFTVEQQEALLVLLEKYIPKLSEKPKYALRHKRVEQPNGHIDVIYKFVIRNEYKNMLVRAPYYDDTLRKEAMVRNGWI